jgi:hypothetical protein
VKDWIDSDWRIQDAAGSGWRLRFGGDLLIVEKRHGDSDVGKLFGGADGGIKSLIQQWPIAAGKSARGEQTMQTAGFTLASLLLRLRE